MLSSQAQNYHGIFYRKCNFYLLIVSQAKRCYKIPLLKYIPVLTIISYYQRTNNGWASWLQTTPLQGYTNSTECNQLFLYESDAQIWSVIQSRNDEVWRYLPLFAACLFLIIFVICWETKLVILQDNRRWV